MRGLGTQSPNNIKIKKCLFNILNMESTYTDAILSKFDSPRARHAMMRHRINFNKKKPHPYLRRFTITRKGLSKHREFVEHFFGKTQEEKVIEGDVVRRDFPFRIHGADDTLRKPFIPRRVTTHILEELGIMEYMERVSPL